MKITTISFGTEGDTRPMVALCRGLIAAGHEATLLAESSGAGLAALAGVPFVALAGDMHAAVTGLLSGKKQASASASREAMVQIAKQCSSAWMRTLLEHARGCDAILFSGLAPYVALSVAEYLKVPAVGAGLQPTVAATREFPSPFLPVRIPDFLNRWSHRFVMSVVWKSFREAINASRAEVTRQGPRQEAWSGYPIVFGVSPHLVPQPADWPDNVRMTGFWQMPSPEWKPEGALADFLAAGEPPVFVGFGSMTGFDHGRIRAAVLAALDGRRALLSSGWSGMDAAALPPNVFSIGAVPHDRLFPQVSMVIHHGGAGTSHTATRAGVPSIVVPFAGDQFFWGVRLAKAGVAPKPIPNKSLDAGVLRQRMREAESMKPRAAELGAKMRAENGVEVAVKAIEGFLSRRG